MTYRGPWNAAGLRHRQTPRRYKASKPVGGPLPSDWQTSHLIDQVERPFMHGCGERWGTCKHCGYHVCSCERQASTRAIGGLPELKHAGPNHLIGTVQKVNDDGTAWVRLQPQLTGLEPFTLDRGVQPMPAEPTTSVEYIRADGTARVNIGKHTYKRSRAGYIYRFEYGCNIPVCDETARRVQALIASAQAAAKQTFERIMGAQKREMTATLEGICDQIVAEAHRASVQAQGGTAASTCNHSGIGLLGCEVCDPLAKVRQASERVRYQTPLGGTLERIDSIAERACGRSAASNPWFDALKAWRAAQDRKPETDR